MKKENYSELLKDPRWQKKRLEIMQRDEFTCQHCGSSTEQLHVHHRYYDESLNPWEYENESLITLCENCHKREHNLSTGTYMDFTELKEELAKKGFSNLIIPCLLSNISHCIFNIYEEECSSTWREIDNEILKLIKRIADSYNSTSDLKLLASLKDIHPILKEMEDNNEK